MDDHLFSEVTHRFAMKTLVMPSFYKIVNIMERVDNDSPDKTKALAFDLIVNVLDTLDNDLNALTEEKHGI